MSQASTPHKPRKKKRQLVRSNTLTDIAKLEPGSDTINPEFNLVSFLLPARGKSQWISIPLILIFTGLFRWTVGVWGYSGQGVPPMHGDFEAQRHWMEVTQHTPVSMWYFYDLPYWGLDYPPLTAYHSWICGKIGTLINPEWFALFTSRGYESQDLKVYMRATVIISEYFVYVAALIIFIRHYSRSQGIGTTAANTVLVAILMQPATMLIDHGHFQYNTVMLGFVIASLSSIYANRPLWSCIYFVLALGFKQMALYYAPAIFAYLLGSCLTPRLRIGRLLAIAIITILAFAAVLAPLTAGTLYDLYRAFDLPYRPPPPFLAQRRISLDPSTPLGAITLQLFQTIHRIFPFARGLFEDKVANFWCTLHTFYKLHNLEPYIQLPRLSAYFTFMSILPSMAVTLSNPKPSLLPYAFASSAFGFFLFSFQVHEKSILLPLLPLTLLLCSKKGLSKEYRAWVGFANALAVFTMFPLLRRDGLRTPYTVLSLLWAWLLGLPPLSASCYYDPDLPNVPGRPLAPDELRTPTKIFHWWFYAVMGFWHLLAAFAEPPETKPDLWVVVNACVGCAGFAVCYGWCTWKLVLESGLLDEYFEYTEKYLEGLMGGDGDAADGKDNENDDTIVVQSPGGEKAVAKGRGKGGKKRR
ncbi:Glucosyltransferase-like protein [Knufia obscura]|uniref:Alpha-1,3-glucosyltransferase n=2 Tax=Knufia TaxID=430999 RepID=A0AAN8F883_9EURO|nr:Glucosyltransferase-like protein [Knufia obscura]KAK5953111.1 Glucosyltransferase-like protein [Knufia fluminis]